MSATKHITKRLANKTSNYSLAKSLSAVLSLFLLAGCVVGPDYQKPNLSLPASWSKSNNLTPLQPAQLANWWYKLNDPLLDQLIDVAIRGNNDVATAKAKIREARASLASSNSTLFPSLNGSSSYNRSRTGTQSDQGAYRGGLDSSWEIDLFGANRRGVEASRYGLDAANEDLRATLVTMIGDVASYYVEVRSLQAKLALTRESVASQQSTAKLTRDKFAAGAVSQLDVSNAEGQTASTEANIPQLESQLASATHRLAVLTGQQPAALNAMMAKRKAIPTPKWPIASGIPADILLNRPDVRVSERQYAAATARIGQKEAARYPSLSLTGNISTSASQIGDLGRNSSIAWAVGPSFSVPIFNGGQRAADVMAAEAQRDQYFIAYRAKILTALEEVENALVALSKDRIRAAKLGQAERSYRQALDLSRNLYTSGNTSFLDLLTAERSHYSAQQSYIDAQASITTDYIALMKALGGGWNGTLDTTRKEVTDSNTGPHIQPRANQ
ncbi:efflux transporter outer membrane subunit [Bartonella sp. HY038]|uniref:efflux transporter outer membrane subunit n=1 Tax=Bartonella sp. HY038 TaxID=2759660 RepID=UPI0015FC7391|nr:efflux transporter outer membrane subunit [Bartonella sp. HY038]